MSGLGRAVRHGADERSNARRARASPTGDRSGTRAGEQPQRGYATGRADVEARRCVLSRTAIRQFLQSCRYLARTWAISS